MAAPAKFSGNELGRTGLTHFSGTIYEEYLPQLQGLRGMRVYREMRDNTPTLSATLFAIEYLLRSVDWTVEPAADTPPALESADFVASCMDDMSHSWEDLITEILSMLQFGWSYFEVVYKQRKGRKADPPSKHDDRAVGWRKIAIRGQETLYHWEIDAQGGIKGMWQYPIAGTPYQGRSNDIVYLPIEKCLLFRVSPAKNNPEGRSILRSAYRPYYIAKRIEDIEAIGTERDLAGLPIAKVPIEILSQDRTAEQTLIYHYIKDVVVRTKRDQQEGIIWPLVYDPATGNELYKFELLSAGGKRSFDTGSIIQRYHQQMAITSLADFILLGHENVGSFALSSDKTELFAVALGSWLDSIQAIFNEHAIPRLMELNPQFDTSDGFPAFRHGDIEKPDIAALGAFVQHLAAAGAPLFPDVQLENALRYAADLPPVDEEERALQQQQQALMQQFLPEGPPGGGGPQDGSGPQDGAGGPGANGNGRKPTVAGEPDEDEAVRIGKAANLSPSYWNGSRWVRARGRHRFR